MSATADWGRYERAAYMGKTQASFHDVARNHHGIARFRRLVLDRDKHKCVLCDSDQDLHVHHLLRWHDKPILRMRKANGVTLCKACHQVHHQGTGHEFPQEITYKLVSILKSRGQSFKTIPELDQFRWYRSTPKPEREKVFLIRKSKESVDKYLDRLMPIPF
jgi:hypothetical protein